MSRESVGPAGGYLCTWVNARVKAVGRGETRKRENEPPSALSLSSSKGSACARPAKRRRRRGSVRGSACAPERWWVGARGLCRAHDAQSGLKGADVAVAGGDLELLATRGGDAATW
ncbi:hypothetical protein SNOG_00085 [Parastagonospora nodorum SN15]|uniref:Uncharacterized protein n=1 Tax=Phaeosphaeria nodorum (strain SN15 / ATCC MYA-4574 / FGSC 10173) TaxID=321614 RepID=Q0V7C9_PHANO|nr:hypothetical protein SNOG_00085 [Parastagonospora nodorum SN15]EAT91580.1 hypothetical protein SNOG_00085 [Parastagonospora nodorum SN15]